MKSKINIDIIIKYIKRIQTKEEKKLVEDWLNESDENRKQYESFLYYWNASGSSFTGFTPNITEGWKKIKNRTVGKDDNERRQTKLFILKIAAAIILLFGLSWGAIKIYNNGFLLLRNKVLCTATDKVKKVTLKDNSTVWLNTGSRLITPRRFNKNSRRVSLTGEAFFYIKNNSHNPFYVKTGETMTMVLGTSFNIRSKSGEDLVNVTVETGRVAFYRILKRSGKIILGQGDLGKYDKKTRTLERKNNPDVNYLAWKTRKLVFHNTDLKDVCRTLNDYYHINILTGELPGDGMVFTGSFHNALLKETLEIIELTLDLKFIRTGEADNPTFRIKLNN